MSSASLTERILGAVVRALNQPGAPAAVDRSRIETYEREDLPAISVYVSPGDQGGEDVQMIGGRAANTTERRLQLEVVSRVAGDDAALDPLRIWVVSRLMASPSLDGLALNIEETGARWEYSADMQGQYATESRRFVVRYMTRRDDLTAAV